MRKYILSVSVITVTILVLILIIYLVRSEPSFELEQPDEFYKNHFIHTKDYLKRVYPIASKTIDGMSFKEIARFYNKLDFIYNCCYEYSGDLAPDGGWKALPCCSNEKNKLPYAPQGYFYFWPTYAKFNKPTAYSSGKYIEDEIYPVSLIGSQRPDIPWGVRPDGGEVDALHRSGPAPFWVTLFTLVRNIFYPFGPVYDSSFKKWTYRNGINVDNTSDNMGFYCKTRNWASGLAMGEYVEVTHSGWEPGMTQSQGFWLNPFFGGGTGMFYKIGKTIVAPNKLAMLFKLLQRVSSRSSSQLNLPDAEEYGGQNFRGMNGVNLLKHWYGTSDPYLIVWKYCADDPQTGGLWGPMAKTSSGGWLVVPKQWVGIDNKGVLAATGLFNPGSIGVSGTPYGPNAVVTFSDVAKWYSKLHGFDNLPAEKIRKRVIDDVIKCKDYLLDRVCTIVTFDEPIFWLSVVLGIETVQMPISANGNGLWSPEIIHTHIPNPVWRDAVKARVYLYVDGDDSKSMFDISKGAPRYTMDGHYAWQDMISTIITERNPFNLSQARKCKAMGAIKDKVIKYNDKFFTQWGSCNSVSTDQSCWKKDMNDYGYKTFQCATNGQWGVTEPGAADFPKRTFWGYYDEKKGCYPFYEGIFCENGLSADYGMIRIYNGKDVGRV